MSADALTTKLAEISAAIDRHLDRALPPLDVEPRELCEAMRYSALAGGKRLRPALTCLVCESLVGGYERALDAAAAIECAHAYSLIHDDLPAMDNDDMRRGRPSNHKMFGEAMAILAGDALLTFAFELCVRGAAPEVGARLALELSRAAGPLGMVGGQVLDLRGEGRTNIAPGRAEQDLTAIHRWKTGALIRVAAVAGAIVAGAAEPVVAGVACYAEAVGHAFQIQDDILDVTADSAALGKTAGKDVASGKLTYPALLGLEGARERALGLMRDAEQALVVLPANQSRDLLAALARFVVERTK